MINAATTDRLVTREQNNFNLLRLMAALGVIVTHSYSLLGKPERDVLDILTHGLLSFSRLGVYVFFIISGFLVANSLERSKSIRSFFWKRFLRIFPGLLVVLLATVFLLGPLVTELPLREYFGHLGTYRYILGGASLYWTIYTLPGVFKHNLYPGAVNGSLWTLPYEWTCYCLLAILAPLLKKRRIFFLAAFVIFMLGIRVLVGHFRTMQVITFLNLDTRQLTEWACLFFLGAFALDLRKYVRFTFLPALLLLLGSFLLRGKVAFYWMLFALPYITLWLAEIPLPKKIVRWFSGIDFSYGFYIYAFPIGQVLAGNFKSSLSVPNLALLTITCTLPFAILSWYFIEKPMLRFKLGSNKEPPHNQTILQKTFSGV